MPPQEAKLVLHHDDGCTEKLEDDGYCAKCRFDPDMQSTALWFYCPTCVVPLEKLQCPKCHVLFRKPD